MENFNIIGVHWKMWFYGGGFIKNEYIGEKGGIAQKRELGQFKDLRRDLAKKRVGGVFEGVDNQMHTMI